jgi:peptide/nickel transport system permease protein
MLRFTARRLGSALLLLWVVLTSTFFLLHLAPGDPIQVFDQPGFTEAQRQNLRAYYGLDQPVVVQYATWLGAVLRGDWGVSISQHRSAVRVLAETFPNTLLLVAAVLVVEYGVGVGLGVASAARTGKAVDHQIRAVSLVLFALPVFWLGIVLIELFAVRWDLFPVGQMRSDNAAGWPWYRRAFDLAHHLVLPATALGLARCASVMRYVRTGLLEILSQDYIRTARAIGLGPGRVLWVHALKNALGPLIQRFGFTLPGLLSGTIVTEFVFAWPGLGRATLDAVFSRDYPVVLAVTGLSGVIVVASTLAADLLHAAVDPRVRDP